MGDEGIVVVPKRPAQGRRNGKRGKYGAIRAEVDGHKFASKAEARRYVQLKDMEARGEIDCLVLQERFALYAIVLHDEDFPYLLEVVSPERNAEMIGHYVADFTYWRGDEWVVEDVKGGPTTDLFKWKKRMMKSCYNIDVVEVRLGRAEV
jgi:hypothetical protein